MSWPQVKLGDICEFAYGKSLPADERSGSGFPVYGSNGVVGYHDVALTTGKTIVIGRKGSFGEVHFSEGPCSPIDTTYFVTDAQTKVYLPWLVRRLRGLGLTNLNRAAAIPGLNREDAYRQPLLLPPLAEQKRIAGILDAADALRAKRRAALAQLDTLLQATFLDLFGDPLTNPMGWNVEPLEDLCSKIIDCPHSTPEYSEQKTDLYCVRSADIQTGRLDLSNARNVEQSVYDARVRRHLPDRGEVIYTREGGRLGLAALVPPNRKICLGQRMMLFDADQKRATNSFMWGFLNTPSIYQHVNAMSGGGAAPRVNIKQLRKIEAICPPLRTQHMFDRFVRSVEGASALHRKHLAELDALFASLQSRAFRGEL